MASALGASLLIHSVLNITEEPEMTNRFKNATTALRRVSHFQSCFLPSSRALFVRRCSLSSARRFCREGRGLLQKSQSAHITSSELGQRRNHKRVCFASLHKWAIYILTALLLPRTTLDAPPFPFSRWQYDVTGDLVC